MEGLNIVMRADQRGTQFDNLVTLVVLMARVQGNQYLFRVFIRLIDV